MYYYMFSDTLTLLVCFGVIISADITVKFHFNDGSDNSKQRVVTASNEEELRKQLEQLLEWYLLENPHDAVTISTQVYQDEETHSTQQSNHEVASSTTESSTIKKRMKYQYIGKAATYKTSKQHCSEQERRLCYSSEVCPKNVPVSGVINGDMWVAVQDRTNEWIEIGDSGGRTCWIHGVRYGAPPWGNRTDGSFVEHVGYVLCCLNSE
ncbi:uncharacterized protein LOC120339884 [Styela clava]